MIQKRKEKIKYIEAPELYIPEKDEIALFLAGGITNCPDWQAELVKILNNVFPKETKLIIYNPRRKNFPINDPEAAFQQIEWEFNQLKEADIISFWFSRGSPNPIVLFEFGKWFSSGKSIVVGIDLEYERQKDVEIQTRLQDPDLWKNITYSISDLALKIKWSYNIVLKKKIY